MEKALRAALDGPEVKLEKVNGHEFNFKPVSYRVNGNEITVFGQVSHCLAFRADDQVWYTFRKTGNNVLPRDPVKMVVQKEEGGALKTIAKLKDVGIFVGALFGIDAGKYFDKLEDNAGNLSFIDFDSGWEKAASSFFRSLADRVAPPNRVKINGLQLFEHDNMRGKSIAIPVDKDVPETGKIGWNDRASSLLAKVPSGKKLQIFQHSEFRGLALELGVGDHIIRDLKIHKIGDAISSVKWENV